VVPPSSLSPPPHSLSPPLHSLSPPSTLAHILQTPTLLVSSHPCRTHLLLSHSRLTVPPSSLSLPPTHTLLTHSTPDSTPRPHSRRTAPHSCPSLHTPPLTPSRTHFTACATHKSRCTYTRVMRHASCVMRHASCVMRHASCRSYSTLLCVHRWGASNTDNGGSDMNA